jgi:2-polyprenyl-6-methoxyphenol hydroxylase-like FAD-dependent oxidoreductase
VWSFNHRANLHELLRRYATAEDGEGPAAKVHYGCRTVKVDATSATLYLSDGTKHSGDVVIGADGVHSATRPAVNDTIKAAPGHHSAFRFLVPRSIAMEDPRCAKFFSRNGSMDIWCESDHSVLYFCSWWTDLHTDSETCKIVV